mgnify:CR=1 FL=1
MTTCLVGWLDGLSTLSDRGFEIYVQRCLERSSISATTLVFSRR